MASDLDEALNGEKRIIGLVINAFKSKEYQKAKEHIKQLADSHPYSAKNEEFKLLSIKIDEEINTIKRNEIEAEKERVRLANLNNTGSWEILIHGDGFGDKVEELYMQNKAIRLSFYQDKFNGYGELRVTMICKIIDGNNEFNFRLYESNNHNYVKKGKDGNTYEANIQRFVNGTPINYGKIKIRGSFKRNGFIVEDGYNSFNATRLHKFMLKGGEIFFTIFDTRSGENIYKFVLNGNYYNNAQRVLRKNTDF